MEYIVTIEAGDTVVILGSFNTKAEAQEFIQLYKLDWKDDDNLGTIGLYGRIEE